MPAARRAKKDGRKRGASRRFVPVEEAQREVSRRLEEIIAVGLLGLGFFLLISSISYRFSLSSSANWGGLVGHHLAEFFLSNFGLSSYLLFAFLIYWGLLLFLDRGLRKPGTRVIGALALTFVLSLFLAGKGIGPNTPHAYGGVLGQTLSPRLQQNFGAFGTLLLLGITGCVAFFIATDWALKDFLRDLAKPWSGAAETTGWARRGLGRLLARARGASSRVGSRLFRSGYVLADATTDAASGVVEGDPTLLPEADRETGWRRRRSLRQEDASVLEAAGRRGGKTGGAAGPPATRKLPESAPSELPISIAGGLLVEAKGARPRGGDYELPPLDLLDPARPINDSVNPGKLQDAARAIEQRLLSHRIDSKVVAISAGPAITLFELEVGEGQRIASLHRFAPDLAAALKAVSIRIVAPIPGKHTVGIEIPNARRSLVRLRELIEGHGPVKESVPLFLGRDVAGAPVVEDLARMPHLLIAGATGSGKSVCLNSILVSILATKTPDEVRLIMLDPKMVELQNYKSIPHLLCPVVTNMKRAPGVLAWAVETMERRYALLSSVGARNLSVYNALGREELEQRLGESHDPAKPPESMPSIVVIIDEFADLMASAAAEVEVSIQRLAQKSRAVGIHVILATQRPSRDVITGLIKANLPTRISFQVSTRVDSRVVLDANGAEQLLGHGDMLFIPPGTSRLVRAQGTFVSDEEIHGITSYLEQKSESHSFEPTLAQLPTGSGRKARERDELYEEAVRVILEEQRGSATLLQRKLQVGYTRASRLIELMAQDGVVGEFVGSKSREILLTLEEWESQNPPAPDAGEAEPWVLPGLSPADGVFAEEETEEKDEQPAGGDCEEYEENEENGDGEEAEDAADAEQAEEEEREYEADDEFEEEADELGDGEDADGEEADDEEDEEKYEEGEVGED
ncbi:MAG: DNA translocase FtsK [Planctomycetota bacterium]